MTTTTTPGSGWRVVDIVVAAVIAVAFGVVFLAWNAVNSFTDPIFAGAKPLQAILYGVWLLPGVLVGLIVRRPGAAFFGGFVSAAVSVVLGSPYGVDALISGAIQGGAAELAFALTAYRLWTLPVAILGGILSGLAATVHDIIAYYAKTGADFWAVYGGAAMISGAVIAGVGGWLLLRSLVAAGVLADFAVGREQRGI